MSLVLIDTESGDAAREHRLDASEHDGGFWLEPGVVESALSWALRDEGLCRGDVCIPVRDRDALVRDGRIGLAPLADALGRPLAVDADGAIAVMGAAPEERGAALLRGEAPDFTLPDLSGAMHTLSDHRDKKVLLVAYASW